MTDYEILDFVADEHNCSLTEEDNNLLEIEGYSSEGRNWTIEIDADNLDSSLKEQADIYDVNYETYIWLDNFGNGGSGAPHDIEDILNDSKEIKQTIENIYRDFSMIKRCDASVNFLQKM